ncbi:MAG: hypothetical protein FWE12_02105 [Oscillospiraceae bacterium]|nr:hypothetical protein [Oscillospiraceae bacterium]
MRRERRDFERDIVIAQLKFVFVEPNDKSEPTAYRHRVRIIMVWYAW